MGYCGIIMGWEWDNYGILVEYFNWINGFNKHISEVGIIRTPPIWYTFADFQGDFLLYLFWGTYPLWINWGAHNFQQSTTGERLEYTIFICFFHRILTCKLARHWCPVQVIWTVSSPANPWKHASIIFNWASSCRHAKKSDWALNLPSILSIESIVIWLTIVIYSHTCPSLSIHLSFLVLRWLHLGSREALQCFSVRIAEAQRSQMSSWMWASCSLSIADFRASQRLACDFLGWWGHWLPD
jgi:hypothetical protein